MIKIRASPAKQRTASVVAFALALGARVSTHALVAAADGRDRDSCVSCASRQMHAAPDGMKGG